MSSNDRAFTARMPDLEYEALRALSFYTGKPMSTYVVRGVRMVLAEHAGSGIAAVVDEAGARFRETLNELVE